MTEISEPSTSVSMLQRAVDGDADGWRKLAQVYGPIVYGWARRSGCQSADAADVMQETFASVATAIDRFVHMDDCDKCRSVAESIQRDGRWLIDAARSEHHDPLQSETACQIALWKLLETPQESLPALQPAPERQTLGPYRLIRTLGVGGMGTVFLAKHERLDRDCAIKVLPLHRVNQPGWLDRFDREMRTVASLEHPNVVRATDGNASLHGSGTTGRQ